MRLLVTTMLRLRRYRVLLVAAVFTLLAFYRFSLSSSLYGYQFPITTDGKFRTPATPNAPKPPQAEEKPADSKDEIPSMPKFDGGPIASLPAPVPVKEQTTTALPRDAPTTAKVAADTAIPHPTITRPTKAIAGEQTTTTAPSTTDSATNYSKLADTPGYNDGKYGLGGQAKLEVPPPLSDKPLLHWAPMPEHFPVPTEHHPYT